MIKNFENLHHANIVLGDLNTFDLLKNNLKDIGFKIRGNPDYVEWEIPVFGIDEARELSEWSYEKPLVGERKIAIIVASSITLEAQNALLKTLEEPIKGLYFFIVIQNIGSLLPTLLSRAQIIKHQNKKENILQSAQNFLQMPIGDKMLLIKNLAKEEDREPMREIIRHLPETLSNTSLAGALGAKKILLAKRLISLRGASPKMLLEWLIASV